MKSTFTLLSIILALSINSYSQCIMTNGYGSHLSQNYGTVDTLDVMIYTGEYTTLGNVIVGNDYEFTCTNAGTHKYITVTDPNDNVLAHGYSPLTVTGITEEIIRLHYADDAACNVIPDFHTITAQCTSSDCVLPDPLTNDECADAIDLDAYMNMDGSCTLMYMGHNIGATSSTGEVNPSMDCPNSDVDPTPKDIWFTFTVPSTGTIKYQNATNPGLSSICEIYTGTCGNLTALSPVNCTSLFGERTFEGMTPGETVYLRYWDYGSNDEGALAFCIKEATTTSLDELLSEGFKLYPNPTSGMVNIQNESLIQNVKVFNVTGQLVYEQEANQNQTTLDLSRVKSGIYMIKVKSGNTTTTHRLVKQ